MQTQDGSAGHSRQGNTQLLETHCSEVGHSELFLLQDAFPLLQGQAAQEIHDTSVMEYRRLFCRCADVLRKDAGSRMGTASCWSAGVLRPRTGNSPSFPVKSVPCPERLHACVRRQHCRQSANRRHIRPAREKAGLGWTPVASIVRPCHQPLPERACAGCVQALPGHSAGKPKLLETFSETRCRSCPNDLRECLGHASLHTWDTFILGPNPAAFVGSICSQGLRESVESGAFLVSPLVVGCSAVKLVSRRSAFGIQDVRIIQENTVRKRLFGHIGQGRLLRPQVLQA